MCAMPMNGMYRCASTPGAFAVDYVDARSRLHHSQILNSQADGYHFDHTSEYFPDLASLIQKHAKVFMRPFVEPAAPVVFNVSGKLQLSPLFL
jgi:hypothetical protein